MPKLQRKGRGRALTLVIGPNNIHITLVFFHNLYEPKASQIPTLAKSFFKLKYPFGQIDIILGNQWTSSKRSHLVLGEIIDLQKRLIEYFQNLGYEMDITDRAFTPHVDLRGQPESVIKTTINLQEDLKW